MRTVHPVGGFRARDQTTTDHGLILSLPNRFNAEGFNGRSRQPQSNSSTADTGPNGSSLAGRFTYPTRKGSWRRTDLNVAGEKKDDVPLLRSLAQWRSLVALCSS